MQGGRRKKLIEVLAYLTELGPHEQTIARQAIRAGQPVPDRILNAPELLPGLELYMAAFFDLDSERSHGNSLVKIPWSSIVRYAEFYGFDEEQTESLLYFVRRLDDENLKKLAEKQRAANGS